MRRSSVVVSIEWNSASDIIALVLHDAANQRWYVQMWSTSNYHWYLKQEFEYAVKIVSLQWDGEVSGRVRVLSEGKLKSLPSLCALMDSDIDGDLFVYDVCFDYIIAAGNTAANPSTAAVIDGGMKKNKRLRSFYASVLTLFSEVLHLTDLRDAVVPPPMAQRRLDVGARALRHVALPSSSASRWQLATARSSPCSLALLPARTGPLPRVAHSTEKVNWVGVKLPAGAEAAETARQVVLVGDDCVLALVHVNGSDSVFELLFALEANEVRASFRSNATSS